MRDWVKNLLSPRLGERVAGAPPSATGASSFFLWWDLPYGERIVEASVTLEIVRRPEIDRLVSFSLQGALVRPGGGSCHIALQHHPQFPDRSAVTYEVFDAKGRALGAGENNPASFSEELPTRGYLWHQSVPYRLTIERGEEREDATYLWTGAVTNMKTGEREVVQECVSRSPHMRGPVMYVESYSPCDGPGFEARWTNATAVSAEGGVRTVRAMRVDYQPLTAGGCTNTNVSVEDGAFIQKAGQMRVTKPGTTVRVD